MNSPDPPTIGRYFNQSYPRIELRKREARQIRRWRFWSACWFYLYCLCFLAGLTMVGLTLWGLL